MPSQTNQVTQCVPIRAAFRDTPLDVCTCTNQDLPVTE